jgi:hypothetical protein
LQDDSPVQSPLDHSPESDDNKLSGDDPRRATTLPETAPPIEDLILDSEFEPNVDELQDSFNFIRAL